MERTELLKDLERSLDQAKKELEGFREWIELGKPIKVVKYKYELFHQNHDELKPIINI